MPGKREAVVPKWSHGAPRNQSSGAQVATHGESPFAEYHGLIEHDCFTCYSGLAYNPATIASWIPKAITAAIHKQPVAFGKSADEPGTRSGEGHTSLSQHQCERFSITDQHQVIPRHILRLAKDRYASRLARRGDRILKSARCRQVVHVVIPTGPRSRPARVPDPPARCR